jgi:hypothetical protein
MKVLSLRCGHGHVFEGWFSAEEDFADQNGRGLVECPLCRDRTIEKMPSAPRLNLSAAREPAPPAAAPPAPAQPAAPMPAELQAAYLRTVRKICAETEDVGERFPEEARRIHYGETERRGIRGQASQEQRAALAEEGIEILSMPLPPGWKGPAH